MTREEAIEILIAEAVCASPILSCDFCARCVVMGNHCTHPTDKEVEEAVLMLKGASNDMAISALRQQEHRCPCDLCNFGPPSSMRGKPCTMCPAVPKQDLESNVPLTLDELRQMDGEPVWIVEEPDWGHWELSADADDYVADREPSFYGMKHNDPAGRYGLHKLGWLAYRQKPEEGTV